MGGLRTRCGTSPSKQAAKWREALKLGEYFLWRIACGRAKRRQPLNSHRVPQPIEKALARIKAILGNWFCAEVKAGNLIQKPEEFVQFAKLTDAQMLEIGPLLKKGWIFVAAFHEVIERLTPDDEIRALHTRAVANGGNWCLLSVGNFGHVVVWGAEKDKTLAKVKDTLVGRERSSARVP